jgi:septum formation protein
MPISEETTLLLPPPILASASPRRRQWMEALQIPFEVCAPDVDETPLAGEEPGAMVARLARAKAEAVAQVHPDRWVIAADTTVAVDHHVLGKPVDVADAARMLLLIQGRGHQVHTGLCLRRNDQVHALVDSAQVFLRPVTAAQARWYAGTGEPMDKAGAYAAQGIAALFIDRIEGSFATVMGFPVERFGELVGRLGLLGAWLGMP